jgi:hypothetical protein
MKSLYWICFSKFGSLEYNIWTIVPLAWLWLVQSVDTAQAHIYHIRNLPNLYKNQIPRKSAHWIQGSAVSGVRAGHSGFPGYSGPSPETPGCKSIKPLTAVKKTYFTPTQFLTAPPSLPSPLSILLGDFHFQPTKSCESEDLKAPRRGDQGSTQVSKDSSPLPSLPKVFSKEFFPIFFSSVVLVVS